MQCIAQWFGGVASLTKGLKWNHIFFTTFPHFFPFPISFISHSSIRPLPHLQKRDFNTMWLRCMAGSLFGSTRATFPFTFSASTSSAPLWKSWDGQSLRRWRGRGRGGALSFPTRMTLQSSKTQDIGEIHPWLQKLKKKTTKMQQSWKSFNYLW